MGSPDLEVDRDSNEGPQRLVTITKPFYLGVYEVTQEQWEAVMGTNPSNFPAPGNPVEKVNWYDCQDFITNLNYLGIGTFGLPTEAEWEYAYRAGSTTRFCYGDDPGYTQLGDYAWYGDNSSYTTYTVGLKESNAWGLYDMYSNVWEWCSDRFGVYDSSSQTDPHKPIIGFDRVVRGGGFHNYPGHCRSALRASVPPTYMYEALGFRLVRIAP